MKTIRQKYVIKAPVEKVWQALVDPKIIKLWGAGPAKMDDKEGTNFKLWGGDIYGKNIKVVKNKELAQDWYSGKWEKPSRVTFQLASKGNKTELTLIHKDFPEEEANNLNDGWKDYYCGPMKALLEK